MATARDLIQASLRALGVLASGEVPTSTEANEALEALSIMLRRWASNSLDVFAISQDSIDLVVGKAVYSVGIGGDVNVVRPNLVVGAFIRDKNNNDYSLEIVDVSKYRSICSKFTQANIPSLLFPNYRYPLIEISLYPVPSENGYTLFMDSLKPFKEINDLSDEIEFPSEYESAIKWNLAIELAPEYGKRIDGATVALARDSLDTLERMNSRKLLSSPPILQTGKTYNIYTD